MFKYINKKLVKYYFILFLNECLIKEKDYNRFRARNII